MKGASSPAPKSVKSAKGTITKGKGNGKGKRKSEEKSKGKGDKEEHGFVLYNDGVFYHSDHHLLWGLTGVMIGARCLKDDIMEKMVALLDDINDEGLWHGCRDSYDEEDSDEESDKKYKKAVLIDFMIEFGQYGKEGAKVTGFSSLPDLDGDDDVEDDDEESPDKLFGMVVCHGEKVFHCNHEYLRNYKGVQLNNGRSLTYSTVGQMVDKLDDSQVDSDPRHRATVERGTREYPDAVLVDFVTVFGARARGGEVVNACVRIDWFLSRC